MDSTPSPRGLLFDLQKFSVHDGPGIRTTVFLKGCPLRCAWCHNPESQLPVPELSFIPAKCIGCGACLSACPRQAHQFRDGAHVLLRERCDRCGRCAARCPSQALETLGRETTVGEVLAEVLKDRAFYEASGGGLTLSGGEPLLQPEFTGALLAAAKEAGLHCCVETCGFADFARLDRIRPHVDLFLYDLKETDPERHRAFTGAPLEPILENLRRLHAAGARILLRLPVVPTLNARPGHFAAVRRLAGELPGLVGVEVMPYHRFGLGKRDRLGLPPDPLEALEEPSPETVRDWRVALGPAVCDRCP